MKSGIFLFSLLFCPVVFAECVTLDTSAWTQDQKNMRQSVVYSLIYEASENIVPTIRGDQICFKNSTVDVGLIITEQSVLARYTSDESKRQQNMADEQQEISDLRSKVNNISGLTDREKKKIVNTLR